jgi:hypothetical protein
MDYPVFKIGEKIICINDKFDKTAYGSHLMVAWPKLYEIYTVRAIHELQNSIFLNEIVNNSDDECSEPSFFNIRFRKVIIDDYKELHKEATLKKEPSYQEEISSI